MSAVGLLPVAWRGVLADAIRDPGFAELQETIAAERERGVQVLPSPRQVFAAYAAVDPDDVRVVILGQDPYPTPGHAHGLAFSYRGRGTLPGSLRNIVAEVQRDLGVELGRVRGDLKPWADQGVLLLNTALTVRAGEAGSHRGLGWERFVDATIDALVAREKPIVFLLWGSDAKRRARRIHAPHVALQAGHPSPLSVRHFRGCGHFSSANAILGPRAIDWTAIGRAKARQ